MNIFWHELRGRRLSTAAWALSLCVLIVLSILKYRTLSNAGGTALRDMLSSFPQTVQSLFGMNGLDLTTISGYFAVCFLFIAIVLAVQAGLLGVSLLADEERDRTTEFLYTKPYSRQRIISSKLLAGGLIMLMLWLVTYASSVLSIRSVASMSGLWATLAMLMGALGIMQMTFFAIGVCAATVFRRPATSASVVAALIFVSYLCYVAARLSYSLDWMHYLSVFSYFDAADIVKNGSLKLHYVLICGIVSITAIGITYLKYPRRDLQS